MIPFMYKSRKCKHISNKSRPVVIWEIFRTNGYIHYFDCGDAFRDILRYQYPNGTF